MGTLKSGKYCPEGCLGFYFSSPEAPSGASFHSPQGSWLEVPISLEETLQPSRTPALLSCLGAVRTSEENQGQAWL